MFTVINEPVPIYNDKSVLIIILSKDANELLFQCINSIQSCTKNKLNITIGIVDTGSTSECINEIKQFIKDKTKVYKSTKIKYKLILYNYYNFAKNNNSAFNKLHGASYDYVLFCNNDIKLLNDAISHMINTFHNNDNVGTVGARLHFKDGTIQHLGVFCNIENNQIAPGHYGFKKVSTGSVLSGDQHVQGNTAAFIMIDSKVFNKIKFNETYLECFEDVELNLVIDKLGYNNYCNLDAVGFHYESSTRNKDKNKENRQNQDLKKLLNFVKTNNIINKN